MAGWSLLISTCIFASASVAWRVDLNSVVRYAKISSNAGIASKVKNHSKKTQRQWSLKKDKALLRKLGKIAEFVGSTGTVAFDTDSGPEDLDVQDGLRRVKEGLPSVRRQEALYEAVLRDIGNKYDNFENAEKAGLVLFAADHSRLADLLVPDGKPHVGEFQHGGDIKVPPKTTANATASALLESQWKDSELWPFGEVNYCLHDTLKERAVEAARRAIEHIEARVPCLKFIEGKVKQINEDGSVLCDGPHSLYFNHDAGGCASYLGYCPTPGGKSSQQVDIPDGCLSLGTVVHEIGHALGLIHEHQRGDRDDYLDVHPERCDLYTEDPNDREDWNVNFEKSYDTAREMELSYDWGSVMHYEVDEFAKDASQPVLEPKVPGHILGNRVGLSLFDERKLRVMYGCPQIGDRQCKRAHFKEPCPGSSLGALLVEECRRQCILQASCFGISFTPGDCRAWSADCQVDRQAQGNYIVASRQCFESMGKQGAWHDVLTNASRLSSFLKHWGDLHISALAFAKRNPSDSQDSGSVAFVALHRTSPEGQQSSAIEAQPWKTPNDWGGVSSVLYIPGAKKKKGSKHRWYVVRGAHAQGVSESAVRHCKGVKGLLKCLHEFNIGKADMKEKSPWRVLSVTYGSGAYVVVFGRVPELQEQIFESVTDILRADAYIEFYQDMGYWLTAVTRRRHGKNEFLLIFTKTDFISSQEHRWVSKDDLDLFVGGAASTNRRITTLFDDNEGEGLRRYLVVLSEIVTVGGKASQYFGGSSDTEQVYRTELACC